MFTKFAKRNFIVTQFLLLTAVLFSMFLPQSGFTFDGVKQVELTVKNPNGSALWVTNLGAENAKLTVGVRPLDSTGAQERLHASDIAGGKTVRLDDSLPANFRGNEMLFIRSQEDLATLVAPPDFAVDSAEFFLAPSRQENGKPHALPKWVGELGAIGKTGNNVFDAGATGYAPAVKGQTELDKHYAFGVGVFLTKARSSVELKLLSRAGQTIKSLVFSSSKEVFWQAPLGEFASGTYDYPGRIEMKVLSGKAQGFLSIKDVESGQVTPLPIAPFAGEGSLAAPGDAEEESSLSTESGTGGPMLGEESSVAVQSGSGGYAYFSNGVYDSKFSSYTYNVYSAPPNVCGTLNIFRKLPGNNGQWETTSNWICTNSSGQGQKGPWTPSVDQTGENIYIQWPNGSYTVGGDYKVDDVSAPYIYIDQNGGYGVPIPYSFSGGASDAKWGTGFNFDPYGWSVLTATFLNASTGKYYDGWGYNSNYPTYFIGSVSPSVGYNVTWSVTPPPQWVHNSSNSYEWCAYTNDYFYSAIPNPACVPFYGPR